METTTPPNWKHPSEVMRLHKLRMKKRALDYRLCDKAKENDCINKDSSKRSASRNPFKRFEQPPEKKSKFDVNTVDDNTTDGTLFRLLNYSPTSQGSVTDSPSVSFTNAFSLLNSPRTPIKEVETVEKLKQSNLPIDWTLRLKVRLMSTQPFPWNQKLKTCEEASGITGFVRCIDTDTETGNVNLDTSPNARFHQCCLVWQHPSLPWLDLYPRVGMRTSGASSVSLLPVKDRMYQDWLDSFRSLFQLVRAKQCPYFYMLTNTNVCLFRAAGLNGYTEMSAFITPTNRGFRQLLKDEDIEFTMPLKTGSTTNKSPVSNDNTDTGYESLDLQDFDDLEENERDDDEGEEGDWLQSRGLEEDDIKKLSSSQIDLKIGSERKIDDSPESLVYIEGSETQGLFNFLVNCKSIIPISGPLAGVPPTLLSPVAFTGASLTSLKVRESVIRQNNEKYHSMELKGPILPHMIQNICELMKKANLGKFSLTFADVECTKSLTSATLHRIENQTINPSPVKTPSTSSIFGEQNLSDCGLKPETLTKFCSDDVLRYDSIKFCDSTYSCS